ncbi:MAG: phosphotransferase [Candidatus Cloacimonetes bacterium]|nr:phosphotransferase [Candidatus Cloacimonadota bacterium]
MILAAGYGSRLQSLTKTIPKPLVYLDNSIRIIDSVIRPILDTGINSIYINLYHRGKAIRDYLLMRYPCVDWHFLLEEELLGTGGGILNTMKVMENEPLLVCNSDILHRIDLHSLIARHEEQNAIATMALLSKTGKERAVLSDNNGVVHGFTGRNGESVRPVDESYQLLYREFAGISIIEPELIKYAPKKVAFGFVEMLLNAIDAGQNVRLFDANSYYWLDLGTPERLAKGRQDWQAMSEFAKLRNESAVLIKQLAGAGGNVRRISGKSRSIIARNYSSLEEIRWHEEITSLLSTNDVAVPETLLTTETTIYEVDAGQDTLLSLYEQEEVTLADYKAIIDICVKYGQIPIPEPVNHPGKFEFDHQSVVDDLNYFNRHYYNNKLLPEEIEKLANTLFDKLAETPLSLMHRDLQSANIIKAPGGEWTLVDIDGFRKGFLLYDVASLLLDSYVCLPESEIEDLLDYF